MMYQPDYIVTWDFSKEDMPVVSISCVRSNEKATCLEMDVLGSFYGEKCGVVSVRQLIEKFDAERRMKNEHD